MNLEYAELVERENADGGGADDATEGDGAEAVAGVEGMLAFAIVAGDEEFAFGNSEWFYELAVFPCANFVAGVFFGTVVVVDASVVVWVETVGMVGVVDREDTVFDGDAFAGVGDDAFDDVLVANAGGRFAGKGVVVATVGEDDDLTAFGDVFLAE